MFPPLVSFNGTGPMQPELWSALAAMAPVTSHRPLNEQRYIVWACIHSLYAMPQCIKFIVLYFERKKKGRKEGDKEEKGKVMGKV